MRLAGHRRYLEAAFAEARAAPLSARKAMLAAMLVDAHADRLFAEGAAAGEDVLAFRASLATRSPELGIVFALCALREGGPRLVTEAVAVPIEDYPALQEADFMVSLYNAHTVQRVRVVLPDGRRLLVHDVIETALACLAKVERGG